jgi:hypothetical protein
MGDLGIRAAQPNFDGPININDHDRGWCRMLDIGEHH